MRVAFWGTRGSIAKPGPSTARYGGQWFKSCYGVNMKETSRDAAFCSHVVYDREPMIVPDTFLDTRFADNPLVINEPRIRFLCRLSAHSR